MLKMIKKEIMIKTPQMTSIHKLKWNRKSKGKVVLYILTPSQRRFLVLQLCFPFVRDCPEQG
jgi:hypothetical protein